MEEGKEKKEGTGEGRERERESGRGKRKGKGRWKEDSLRNVGRTDARTHARTHGHKGDFILCPMLWTDKNSASRISAEKMCQPKFGPKKFGSGSTLDGPAQQALVTSF